jgi:hypothetical protein
MNSKSEPRETRESPRLSPFPDQILSELEEAISPKMSPPSTNSAAPHDTSFAPPERRGIHELIKEIEDLVKLTESRLRIVRKRLEEFDTLQSSFYLGTKP